MSDPYGRPTLIYRRDRGAIIEGSPKGWRSSILVGGRIWHAIENAEARPVPAGRCFGLVRYKGNGAPCIWLHWGDPDGGEEHQIHAANRPGELSGCIAPGIASLDEGVSQSRDAMTGIFKALVEAASYGEFERDDGALVDYHNPPLGLAVIVEVVEVGTVERNGRIGETLAPVRWVTASVTAPR